jgi:hypothetical protein
MIPLVHELTARDCYVTKASRPTDLPRCKRVATTRGVQVDATKILRDRAKGRNLSAESMQLGVMRVSIRATSQYGLRQERLAPQRNEAASVKVLGVHGPKTHSSAYHRADVQALVAESSRQLARRSSRPSGSMPRGPRTPVRR